MHRPTAVDFGVKFGRDPSHGLEGQQSFPFIYTFVNRNDDKWVPNASYQAGPQSAFFANLSSLGPVVPAGSKITHNVLLDPDYNYKLIAIKYSAYKYYPDDERGFNMYLWYDNMATIGSLGMDPDMDFFGALLTRYVKITLSFLGSGNSVIQHGGLDHGPLGGQRLPLPLEVKQGYESGYYVARSPHLLPREGMMVFEITNSFSLDLVVAAAIYGIKIRL